MIYVCVYTYIYIYIYYTYGVCIIYIYIYIYLLCIEKEREPERGGRGGDAERQARARTRVYESLGGMVNYLHLMSIWTGRVRADCEATCAMALIINNMVQTYAVYMLHVVFNMIVCSSGINTTLIYVFTCILRLSFIIIPVLSNYAYSL